MDQPYQQRSEPMLNVPPAIAALCGAFLVIHVVREFLPQRAGLEALLYLAFIPARYDSTVLLDGPAPGGFAADLWTFVTYAFLHADWTHLIVNSVWLLAFGSAVAWRFGTLRFLVFFAVTAAAGALVHLFAHAGDFAPLVGASGALSGCMAAAARFAFEQGAPLGPFRAYGAHAYRMPAVPLLRALRNPRIVAFLAVWLALNLVFGLGSLSNDMVSGSIAWEAHLGGFAAGLLAFPAFDPVPSARSRGLT